MSAIRHADARRPASIRESASCDVDELAWPPSSDDLDAIEVVPVSPPSTDVHTGPPMTLGPTLAVQTRAVQTLPSPPGLVSVHDFSDLDADADTFRSEDDHGPAAVRGLLQPADRGRSWTPLALYAAASVIVLTTTLPFVWTPAGAPDLPQIAASSSAPTPAAPVAAVPEAVSATPPDAEARTTAVAAPLEPRLAGGVSQAPVSAPAPAPVRVPSAPSASATSAPPAPVQFVSPPESQRVRQPEAQPARPVDTMVRGTVPVVLPPGALPTTDMAPMRTAAPRDVSVAAPAPPATPVLTVPVAVRTDDVGVQAALQRYGSAYSRLDARAAQAVWPSVDARALARAFEGLESQSLQFDRCELEVRETVARAECFGTATYVRRIGSKAARTEPRAWTFSLRKSGDAWQILSAAAR